MTNLQTSDPIRRATMRAVKSKDTEPEIIVRKFVYSLGIRYRLHREDLPGKPDLVFAPLRRVVFVHGCFWHGHACNRGDRVPKTNAEYWTRKIEGNRRRDQEQVTKLSSLGWKSLALWECELRQSRTKTLARLARFLQPPDSAAPQS
jgi:DNA mismatch endonuclease, patch repair protein